MEGTKPQTSFELFLTVKFLGEEVVQNWTPDNSFEWREVLATGQDPLTADSDSGF